MRSLIRCLPVLPALLLAGCASLNPVTLAKLARLDMLEADPGAIVVAAVAPTSIRLSTGDVKLTLKLDSDDPDWVINEVVLLEVAALTGADQVSHDLQTQNVTMARVPQDDLERLANAQKKARAFKTAGRKDGKGSLSVGVSGGCIQGALPDGPLEVSIYLKTERGGEFLPVINALDLRKIDNGALVAKILPCE